MMEENKSKPKYKTAAEIRRVIEDRLADERLDLADHQTAILLIDTRIGMILDLLKTVDANGPEEGHDEG